MTKQTLGQRIAEKRCGCGMPQETLAEQLNVTPQTMGKGENDVSSPNVLRLIDGGRGGSAVAGGHPERNAYGAVGGLNIPVHPGTKSGCFLHGSSRGLSKM